MTTFIADIDKIQSALDSVLEHWEVWTELHTIQSHRHSPGYILINLINQCLHRRCSHNSCGTGKNNAVILWHIHLMMLGCHSLKFYHPAGTVSSWLPVSIQNSLKCNSRKTLYFITVCFSKYEECNVWSLKNYLYYIYRHPMPLQSWWWFTTCKVQSEQQVKGSQVEKVSHGFRYSQS